ncbi:MAG: hypothetical protein GX330_07550 [Bacteroidales bacterium]|nr:hypothetical protein [Bacteroidales bacterium]
MDKFQNKYRGKSTRLRNWDYSWAAAYFVTICTKHRIHYFGEIKNGRMELSEIGNIVENEWLKTFEIRLDMNLQMGEFTIMPNHFHAIITIGKNKYNIKSHTQSTNTFGPQSKNLASIIRGFKIGVTKNARQFNPDFAWQPLFYDHIIQNDKSYQRITNYIINNPKYWQEDKFYE